MLINHNLKRMHLDKEHINIGLSGDS